jgi:hypothetical protein
MEQTHIWIAKQEWMKTMISLWLNMLVVLFAVGPGIPALASPSPAGDKGDFEFVFRLDSEAKAKLPKAEAKFKYRTQAPTYEEAYKKAANACFSHYKAGERVPEDVGLLIIDTCANPRGS